ncbi:MAG: TetR family transcriptional regulator [Spirochaetales bacterium]|nr:TetR family transcriptional regulator [Spirochaetales bacterium]
MFYHIEDKALSRTILKTRRRILETSFGLFARNGIFKTTMVDIADAVGLTRRTLYNHYDTKEDLAVLLHKLLLGDVLDNCNYKLEPEEMDREGIKHCLVSLYDYISKDQDRLSFTVYFDQYARERNDLIGEENLFVNYLLANTQIIDYFSHLKKRGVFRDETVSPELMAKICFESLIAYMERISFRSEAHKEQGIVRYHDFVLLIDKLLRGIEGASS